MSAYSYPNPQAIFYQQYEMARRDEVVGILLALFLGTFGVHHFYLRRTGLGMLYLCFFWSGIPSILGMIECFFMPARVREYNAIQAAGIAATLGIPVPLWSPPVGAAMNMPPAAPLQPSGPAPAAGFVPAVGFVPAAGFVAGTVPVVAPAQAPCPKCERMNPATAKFCIGCGQPL